MLKDIKVIAFDIDGTLYPDYRLYRKLVFYVLRHAKFYMHFLAVRKILHRTAPLSDFYEYQGRLLAEELGCSVDEARFKIDSIVYKGLTPYLERTKPFSHVEECFSKIKEAGYRIALLSDFPPSQKGDTWGLLKYCDVVLGSEESGALKPSKYPFGILSLKMNVRPEEILYVGNSIKYDVCGSKNAGMKSALIMSRAEIFFRRLFGKPSRAEDIGTDILFSDYRQFTNLVLQ
ncbi:MULTISPECIES: HAD family hydrolase [Treponema]|uniref:HAD family hydrolase n=1 Tax=Treponema TaxID=157 RepID=UPI00257E14E6|nr:HAD family hydrolase [Treponema sp.]MBQ5537719.1 HAD family hydrolase [Treponema sp.]